MPPMRGTEVVLLNSSPIVACAPVGHPLARSRSVSLAQLARYPLVGREEGSKTRRKIEDFAKAQGIDLRFAIEAEGREAMRESLPWDQASVSYRMRSSGMTHASSVTDQRRAVNNERSNALPEGARSNQTIHTFFEVARELQGIGRSQCRRLSINDLRDRTNVRESAATTDRNKTTATISVTFSMRPPGIEKGPPAFEPVGR